MEMSHRSPDFAKIIERAQQSIRDILNISENYKVLFLQGGGTGLFAAVAMNLLSKSGTADYIVTGLFTAIILYMLWAGTPPSAQTLKLQHSAGSNTHKKTRLFISLH